MQRRSRVICSSSCISHPQPHYFKNNEVKLQKQDRNSLSRLLIWLVCHNVCPEPSKVYQKWKIKLLSERGGLWLFHSLKTKILQTIILQQTTAKKNSSLGPHRPWIHTHTHTHTHTPSFPPLHAASSAAQSLFVVWRCVSAGLGEIMWARTQFKGQCSGAFASPLPHCLPFPTPFLSLSVSADRLLYK